MVMRRGDRLRIVANELNLEVMDWTCSVDEERRAGTIVMVRMLDCSLHYAHKCSLDEG